MNLISLFFLARACHAIGNYRKCPWSKCQFILSSQSSLLEASSWDPDGSCDKISRVHDMSDNCCALLHMHVWAYLQYNIAVSTGAPHVLSSRTRRCTLLFCTGSRLSECVRLWRHNANSCVSRSRSRYRHFSQIFAVTAVISAGNSHAYLACIDP